MNESWKGLNQDDVISLNSQSEIVKTVLKHSTFTVGEFGEKLLLNPSLKGLGENILKNLIQELCAKGIDGKALVINKGWQKGKIRLSLAFIPDIPESSLDESENISEIKENQESREKSLLDDIRKNFEA